jgi:Domain of unknown function (DUF4372)/Transposase DDE domain
MGLISYKQFQTIVNRYFGDYKVREFSCWKQFLYMAFGQLTSRESITDTMMCFKANTNKMYHVGIGVPVSVSTIIRANESRCFKIYEDFAMLFIKEPKQLYINDDDLEVLLNGNVFAIDATTIDLCLSSFSWATFRSIKGGIKLHTKLDLKTAIPEFILFTNAAVHDVNVLDAINFETNSFYIMDRGYVDYKRLYKVHLCNAFFVTRTKDNTNYRRLYSRPVDKTKGIIFDQTILLNNNYYAAKDYPQKMRIIKYKDETGRVLILLTNNFYLAAPDIAQTSLENRIVF